MGKGKFKSAGKPKSEEARIVSEDESSSEKVHVGSAYKIKERSSAYPRAD